MNPGVPQHGLNLLVPEEVLARFQILRPLGQGGMGDVFLARSLQGDELVAIKVMRSMKDPDQVKRFLRECETLSRLEHPYIIGLHEYGAGQGGPYMVMPFVEGRTLADGPAPPDPQEFMARVAEALQSIHDLRLVHRDVKPANLMMDAAGNPRLIDFGVVLDQDQTKLTSTGGMIGTLSYMAPELLMGQKASPAADWYAWGVTAYQIVEGTVPFITGDLMAAAHTGVLRPPRLEALLAMPGLAEAVLRCLSFTPSQRPAHAREIREIYSHATGGRLQQPPVEDFGRCLPPRQPGPRDPGAARHYRAGLQRDQAGDLPGAREAFKRAAGSAPEEPAVWIELGVVLTRMARWDEALDALDQALRRDPRDLEALRCQGLCLERVGRGASAVESFRRFLALAPPEMEQRRQEAVARIKAFEEGDTLSGNLDVSALVDTWKGLLPEERRRELEREPTLAGEPAPLGAELVQAARERRGAPAPPAGSDPVRMVPGPGSPPPEPRSLSPETDREPEPARAEAIPANTPRCDPPLAVPEPGSESDQAYREALAALREGDQQRGEDALRRAFARDPRHLPACRELGILLTDQGRFLEAVRPLEEAVRLDEADYEALRFQGICLERLNRPEEAELSYRSFLESAPRPVARARAHVEKRLQELAVVRRSPRQEPPTSGGVQLLDEVPERPRAPVSWSRLLMAAVFLSVVGVALRSLFLETSATYVRATRPLSVPLPFASAAKRKLERMNLDQSLSGVLRESIRSAVGRNQQRASLDREDFLAVLSHLAENPDRESVRALWLAMDQSVEEVALAALEAMARKDGEEGVRHLGRLISERRLQPESVVVRRALDALSRSQNPETPTLLVLLWVQAHSERRQSAVTEVFYGRVRDVLLVRDPGPLQESIEGLRQRRVSTAGRRAKQVAVSLEALEELLQGPTHPDL